MTEKTLVKIYNRARKKYSDDFASWLAIKLLEGGRKTTTLKNMYCDYVRHKLGRSGNKIVLLDCETKAVTNTTSEDLLLDAELSSLLSFSLCLEALYSGETSKSLAELLGVSEAGLFWQLRRDRAKFIQRHKKELKTLCEI